MDSDSRRVAHGAVGPELAGIGPAGSALRQSGTRQRRQLRSLRDHTGAAAALPVRSEWRFRRPSAVPPEGPGHRACTACRAGRTCLAFKLFRADLTSGEAAFPKAPEDRPLPLSAGSSSRHSRGARREANMQPLTLDRNACSRRRAPRRSAWSGRCVWNEPGNTFWPVMTSGFGDFPVSPVPSRPSSASRRPRSGHGEPTGRQSLPVQRPAFRHVAGRSRLRFPQPAGKS